MGKTRQQKQLTMKNNRPAIKREKRRDKVTFAPPPGNLLVSMVTFQVSQLWLGLASLSGCVREENLHGQRLPEGRVHFLSAPSEGRGRRQRQRLGGAQRRQAGLPVRQQETAEGDGGGGRLSEG